MALIGSLREQQHFTKTETVIANYILTHLSEASTMTITQLAEETYASRSAVQRLCRKVGVEKYPEFRVELAREIERNKVLAHRVDPNQPFSANAETPEIVNALAQLNHRAIDETASTLSVEEIRKAGAIISKARRVVLYGIGDTMASLETFSSLLLKSGIVCVKGYGSNDRYALGGFLDANDVAVLASYTGVNLPEFESQLTGPLSRRCRVVLVTSDVHARDHLLGADCLISLPPGEHHENRGAYFSQACMRFALSCIYGEVLAQTWDASAIVRNRVLLEDEEHARRQLDSH